jgi:hypothetical protein
MIEIKYTGAELYARMERAVERVNARMRRAVGILETANIPYAIVGGYAVRAWVTQIDEAALRTTADVDVLIRPADLQRTITAMTAAGFHYRHTAGVDMFCDTQDGSARDAVHMLLCGQMIRANEFDPNPDLDPIVRLEEFNTVTFESLVRMKLNSFRDKDRTHLRDMISLGMIDEQWLERLPKAHGDRLKVLLADPNG